MKREKPHHKDSIDFYGVVELNFLIESLDSKLAHASKYKNSSREATAQPTPPQIDLFTKQATVIMKHDKQTKPSKTLIKTSKKLAINLFIANEIRHIKIKDISVPTINQAFL